MERQRFETVRNEHVEPTSAFGIDPLSAKQRNCLANRDERKIGRRTAKENERG